MPLRTWSLANSRELVSNRNQSEANLEEISTRNISLYRNFTVLGWFYRSARHIAHNMRADKNKMKDFKWGKINFACSYKSRDY